jgi:hypothetical protein
LNAWLPESGLTKKHADVIAANLGNGSVSAPFIGNPKNKQDFKYKREKNNGKVFKPQYG